MSVDADMDIINQRKKEMILLRSIKRFLASILTLLLVCCTYNSETGGCLEYALEYAGDNRSELEAVLEHYKDESEKLRAAQFLIENMPGHYSFRPDSRIEEYYRLGKGVLMSSLSPTEQNDSLLRLCNDVQFSGMLNDTVQDIRIIKADYLIRNIDSAFQLWKESQWLKHINFDQFCEFILPYKNYELQSLDCWRDTLRNCFGDVMKNWIPNDESYASPYNAACVLRERIARDVHPFGIYSATAPPFSNAETMHRITFGTCTDYVRLGISTMRAIGIPAYYDYTPQWGRYRAGHSWYAILNDKGERLTSEWDITTNPGGVFFPYERIPKVYRQTYAINRVTETYLQEATFPQNFSKFQIDVTDEYYATTDLEIPVTLNESKINDKYVYLAVFNGIYSDWRIISYGSLEKDYKCADGKKRSAGIFPKTGRNVLYVMMQVNENEMFPLSLPFILHTNGDVEYIHAEKDQLRNVTLRRKYFSKWNVIDMQRRVLGGQIQASNDAHFRTADTLLTITDLNYPDRIPLYNSKPYRYWRYLSADGTYGSIAELAFFADSMQVKGNPICRAGDPAPAFDGDYLTNYETGEANGNWVGMDMNKPVTITHARIIPRGDDNYVRVGDMYEFLYWNNRKWISRGTITANDNKLRYDSIPDGALMWLRNLTRGMDERCFLIRSNNGVQEWW